MLEFVIPGQGDKTSDECNTVSSIEYCEDCGNINLRFYHCKNWHCPICYYEASKQAATRVDDRLHGAYHAWSKFGYKLGKVNRYDFLVKHFTFSLPASEYGNFDLKKAKKKLRKSLSMVGLVGGAVVFHPYRIKDQYNKPIYDALQTAELRGGNWRGVQGDILNLKCWEEYVEFAPHFHVLGFFPKMLMKSSDYEAKTGWVYKNIEPYKKRDVYKTARYILTHHAVLEGHSVTYFGICSYNKLSTRIIKETIRKQCPNCNSVNYFQIKCFGYEAEKYISGEKKIKKEDLFLHVRFKVKKRYYFVNSKQSKLEV